MADEDIVRRLHRVFGVGAVYGPQEKRWKQKLCRPIYQWQAGKFEHVQYVLAVMWPWLGERRRAKVREVLLYARG